MSWPRMPGLAIVSDSCPGRSSGRIKRRCSLPRDCSPFCRFPKNFGNVVAEAMIRGLPVVVSERVGAAEIVAASGGGVVSKAGLQDLAAALASVLQSNERRAAMGAAGARYARERLRWDGIARIFQQLYREIVALGRDGAPDRHTTAA